MFLLIFSQLYYNWYYDLFDISVWGSSLTVTVQRLIIGIIILLIIANFGWKIFRRYKAPEEFLLPLTIQFRNKSIHLTGLLDTGNSLTDPVTHLPVVVVDQERLLDLFPIS